MDTGVRQIAAALARSYQVQIQGYCQGFECTVREVQIHVKDYDRELVAMLTARGGLHCPVCGGVLRVEWARTFWEQEQRTA